MTFISAQEETLRRERESLGAGAAETSGLGAEQPEQSPYHDSFGGATPGYQTPGTRGCYKEHNINLRIIVRLPDPWIPRHARLPARRSDTKLRHAPVPRVHPRLPGIQQSHRSVSNIQYPLTLTLIA